MKNNLKQLISDKALKDRISENQVCINLASFSQTTPASVRNWMNNASQPMTIYRDKIKDFFELESLDEIFEL